LERPALSPTWTRRTLVVAATILLIALTSQTTPSVAPQSRGAPAWNAFGMDVKHPYIAAIPSLDELGKLYPAAARRAAVEGLVKVRVTVDESGRPSNTAIVAEAPAGTGFGAAALELAKRFTYVNPTGHSAAVTYKIKFELDRSAR
jgi:TonB family protein